MGQAIPTLRFEKNNVTLSSFFFSFFFFSFSILKTFEITYAGSSNIHGCFLHMECLSHELEKLKFANTATQRIYEEK